MHGFHKSTSASGLEVDDVLLCLFCFPGGSYGKESACSAGDSGFGLGVGKIPWRKAWQPTPVFLSGESHGQRNLVYGVTELDMTEQLTLTFYILFHVPSGHLHPFVCPGCF